jgi:hypothetical protein
MSRLGFLVKSISVARTLSTIEEWRQDQCCFFRLRDCRKKGHNHEHALGSSLETTLDIRIGQTLKFLLGEYITGTKVTNSKIAMGSSLGEDSFCSLETRHNRKTAMTNCWNRGHRPKKKLSWVPVPSKIFQYPGN